MATIKKVNPKSKPNSNPANANPVPEGAKVCSPKNEKLYKSDGTCFTKEALVKIATIWNKNYGAQHGNIKGFEGKTKKQIWSEINSKMGKICNGSETCWVDTLGQEALNASEVAKSIRPLKPKEWEKKPYAWLSNYDIEKVMRQYQDDQEYLYKFLGVFPIDFANKSELGMCISDEICKLNISALYKKGIKYVGMITNLDKHDQPGSHWTSLFFCIDPKIKCYGAYYYDSTFTASDRPPKEINDFINKIREQIVALHGTQTPHPFRIDFNKNKHQYKNTECGVFSMVFQIRWLRKLVKNPDTVFEDVVGIKMNDDDIHQIRDVVFRKSEKKVLGAPATAAAPAAI